MTDTAERRETPDAEDEVIVLDDAAPPPAAPKPKSTPKYEGLEEGDETYGEKVQKRISQLSRRNRAAEAEKSAAVARAEAAERALLEARRHSLTTADAALERDFKQAQARAARAYAEADSEGAAEANAELAQIAAHRAQVQRDVEMTPRAAPPSQPVTYTPSTQEYIDANPWYHEDPDAQALAHTLHASAIRRGLKVDTPKYFDFITNGVSKVYPEHFPDETEEVEDDEPQPKPAPVAAARRTPPGATPPRSNKLPALTRDEADQARRMGVSLQDFARSKAKLAAAGKIGTK